MRAVLAAALLALVTACAALVRERLNPPEPFTPMGFSTWNCHDGRPVGWVRVDVLMGPHAASVVAHEIDHLLWMDTMSCEEWARAVQSLEFNIQVEARAFCASAAAGVVAGDFATVEQAVDYFSFAFSTGYDYGLTPDQARDEIMRYCGVST